MVMVRDALQKEDSAKDAARIIVEAAVAKGSTDDATAVVIQLC